MEHTINFFRGIKYLYQRICSTIYEYVSILSTKKKKEYVSMSFPKIVNKYEPLMLHGYESLDMNWDIINHHDSTTKQTHRSCMQQSVVFL